jgi:mediator of RNA polymerase II transcription subunit 18
VDVLLHRLRGLCDNVDSGPETFHDHEACFVLYGTSSAVQQAPPLTLRVRRAMDDPHAPWHLRYVNMYIYINFIRPH